MSQVHISDTSKGEALRQIGDVNFSYGLNSPFPGESQTPVPSASFQVAGDVDNLYRLDNTARIETKWEGNSEVQTIFGGRFATSSDMPVTGMTIDHQTNELNKDIRSWPIVTDPAMDTSEGRRTITGALRHWYAQCGLTEYGVRGDFLFNTTNSLPNVAYYDNPLIPFMGVYNPNKYDIEWRRPEPFMADEGASFGVGETVTFIVKANNNFGKASEGEQDSWIPSWGCDFEFLSGRTSGGVEDPNLRSGLTLNYFYETNDAAIREYTYADGEFVSEKVTYVDNAAFPGSLDYFIVEATRLSEIDVEYKLMLWNYSAHSEFTFVSSQNYLPDNLALSAVYGTAVDMDYSSPAIGGREGVQGIYVIKGKVWSIQEEDKFEINIPWSNKPIFKDCVIPGLQGNAWTMVNDLCSTYGLQFDSIHGDFVEASIANYGVPWNTSEGSQVSVQASTRELAERVEVVNYNYKGISYFTNRMTVYKAEEVFSVGMGETVEFVIKLPEGSSLSSFLQPASNSVSAVIKAWNNPNNNQSWYSVYDDDNIEVDWRSWDNSGGSVSLEYTDTIGELKMILTGPNNDLISKESTFHLSMAGSDIPSLIIAGSGVVSNKETLSVRTGAGKARNLKPVGITYDNKLVPSSKIAYKVATGLASLYGTTQTKAVGVFPSPGDVRFSTAPIMKHGAYYSPVTISYRAGSNANVSDSVRHTPVRWMQEHWKGLTCAEYEAKWAAGTICREVNISPLGKTHF